MSTAGDDKPAHWRYRFPPFPETPVGVTVTPFEAFRPAGYTRITDEQGQVIEVDAFAGLPTIKLVTEEEALQRKKQRRRRRHAGRCRDPDGRLIPWWEEWEHGEDLRTTSIVFDDDDDDDDGRANYADRVHRAAEDFRVGRTWPEPLAVRFMWDRFRLYVGLLASLPEYRRVKHGGGATDAPIQQELSDDEELPKATQTRLSIVQDTLDQVPHPGKTLEPDVSDPQHRLLDDFTSNMEKSVKIFLSSHMRDADLIWSAPNLFIAPTVLHFFLRFMLRNRVFHDSPSHTNDLVNAVAVARLAIKELPLTTRIAHALPGNFELACKAHPQTGTGDAPAPLLSDGLATGLVERSTRRIRTVLSPTLGAKFAKVILDPWIYSEEEATAEFRPPVVTLRSTTSRLDGEVDHQPYRDPIVLLVDPSLVPLFCEGMGLCGTWVQQLCEKESERCWYVECLMAVFPSFYTEGEGRVDVAEDECEDDEEMD